SLREATLRQYSPFLPINGTASLTRRPERISKWEIFGSPNSIRTPNLLVDSQLFETLCLTHRRRREELPSLRLTPRIGCELQRSPAEAQPPELTPAVFSLEPSFTWPKPSRCVRAPLPFCASTPGAVPNLAKTVAMDRRARP